MSGKPLTLRVHQSLMGSQCVGRLCRLEASGVETPIALGISPWEKTALAHYELTRLSEMVMLEAVQNAKSKTKMKIWIF